VLLDGRHIRNFTIRLFRRRAGAIGRTGRGFVAELSKEARAGPLGAQLERAVILLEILWGFRKPCVSFVSRQPSSIGIRPRRSLRQVRALPCRLSVTHLKRVAVAHRRFTFILLRF